MSDLLHREIAKLRGELEEANETIRQLRSQLTETGPLPLWLPHLSPNEERIFRLLVKREHVTNDTLVALFDDADRSDPMNVVKVYVCRLRRKLTPHGITIKTNWGRGYYLDSASRDLLTGALAA